MTQEVNKTRRSLMAAAAVLPVSALVVGRVAMAEAVDPASDMAKALKYAAESEVEGQDCTNCSLYVAGPNGGPLGTCPLFQGVEVHAAGWCSAWVAKS